MRSKNVNNVSISGYIYDFGGNNEREMLSVRTSAKGVTYIGGRLDIATDETLVNVIPVYFTYVAPYYGSDTSKVNRNFDVLKTLIENGKSVTATGLETAPFVTVSGNVILNDYIDQTGTRHEDMRIGGSFVNVINDETKRPAPEDRNVFTVDMLMTKTKMVEANPERGIESDYLTIHGAVFSFRNELLPVDLDTFDADFISYFSDASMPMFCSVSGHIYNESYKVEVESSDCFVTRTYVKSKTVTNRRWVFDKGNTVYDFGDPDVMTADDVVALSQARETHWAEIKQRKDESAKTAAPAKTGSNSFAAAISAKSSTLNVDF